MSETKLYTGGSVGADTEWINAANKKNHKIKIYRFDGAKHTRVHEEDSIHTIDDEKYEKDAMKSIKIAAEHLKTSLPTDNIGLVKRDYYMIQEPTSLYAVGSFCTKGRLRVNGHTGWIVEMFVDKLLYESKHDNELPVYFMCQNVDKWYKLVTDNMKFNWVHIKKPPEPNGNYIGIGSRELSINGKLEIIYL